MKLINATSHKKIFVRDTDNNLVEIPRTVEITNRIDNEYGQIACEGKLFRTNIRSVSIDLFNSLPPYQNGVTLVVDREIATLCCDLRPDLVYLLNGDPRPGDLVIPCNPEMWGQHMTETFGDKK